MCHAHALHSGQVLRIAAFVLLSHGVAQEKVFAAALAPKAASKQCRQCLSMLSPKALEDPIKCIRLVSPRQHGWIMLWWRLRLVITVQRDSPMPCTTVPADKDRPCRCGSAHYCTHRCMKDDKDAHVQSGECNLLQADTAE